MLHPERIAPTAEGNSDGSMWDLLAGVEDGEALAILLGVLTAAFVVRHLHQIRQFPRWPLPLIAAASLIAGWAVSVAENLVEFPHADLVEHSLYLIHTVLLAAWCFSLARIRPNES